MESKPFGFGRTSNHKNGPSHSELHSHTMPWFTWFLFEMLDFMPSICGATLSGRCEETFEVGAEKSSINSVSVSEPGHVMWSTWVFVMSWRIDPDHLVGLNHQEESQAYQQTGDWCLVVASISEVQENSIDL